MDLIWLAVGIVGCVALAGCVATALLLSTKSERRRLRPLANVNRLTGLAEYVRAERLRTLTAVVSIALLVVGFGAAVAVAARPTGLPSATTTSNANQPEDIMI